MWLFGEFAKPKQQTLLRLDQVNLATSKVCQPEARQLQPHILSSLETARDHPLKGNNCHKAEQEKIDYYCPGIQ